MRFLAKFLEHWKLYLIPIVLIPIVATVYGQHKLTIYESSAYLQVQPAATLGSTTLGGISGNPYASPAQNAADAFNELLLSESFDVKVAQGTDLAKQYDLSVPTNQDIVTAWIQREVSVTPSWAGQKAFWIVVDDKSPHLAQQIASSVIQQFSADYKQSALDNFKRAEALVSQEIEQAKGQLTQDTQRVSQYLTTHPNVGPTVPDATLAGYQQQQSQDQTQLRDLQDQLQQLRTSEAAVQGDIISVFTVLDAPKQPLLPTLKLKKLLIYPGGGLGLALALIALIVGLQTVFDRGVYTQQDVRSILEELDLDIASIEAVPVLHGIGDRVRDEDEGATYSGVLVPVLTVLPHLSSEEMTQELRRVVGVGTNEPN